MTNSDNSLTSLINKANSILDKIRSVVANDNNKIHYDRMYPKDILKLKLKYNEVLMNIFHILDDITPYILEWSYLEEDANDTKYDDDISKDVSSIKELVDGCNSNITNLIFVNLMAHIRFIRAFYIDSNPYFSEELKRNLSNSLYKLSDAGFNNIPNIHDVMLNSHIFDSKHSLHLSYK